MPKFLVKYLHKKDVEMHALVEAANHTEAHEKARGGDCIEEFEHSESWDEIRPLSVRHKTEEEAKQWLKDNDNLIHDYPAFSEEELELMMKEALIRVEEEHREGFIQGFRFLKDKVKDLL